MGIVTSTGSVDYGPSQLTVPARAAVTINFKNETTSPNTTFSSSKALESEEEAMEIATGSGSSDQIIGRTEIVNPDNSDTVVVEFDSSGQ